MRPRNTSGCLESSEISQHTRKDKPQIAGCATEQPNKL